MSTVPRPATSQETPAAAPASAPSGANTAAPHVRFAALQSRNFRLLWIGLLISNAGTWMESTASGWLVTDLEPSHASFWLGVMAAAFAVPMLVLPPLGGAVADRISRLRLLWIVQILYLCLSTALAVVTLTGVVAIWMLVAYAFANGIVLAFDSPVRHALLPDIVSRQQLTSGVSLNSVAFTGAALIGPAIAGALIPLIGVGGVMTVNAASCIATLIALSQMRNVPAKAAHRTAAASIWHSIRQAIAFIRASRMLSGLILLSAIAGLTGRSYSPLLAVFARDEFRVGSTAYGALVSAGGLGTLVGAFGLAGRRDVARRGRLIAVAYVVQGAMLFTFAVSPWYPLALPLLAIIGVAGAVSGATIATLIQLAGDGELRGRVMSLYLLTVVGFPSIGSFIFGALGEPLGVRAAVAIAALIFLIGSMTLVRVNPDVRNAG